MTALTKMTLFSSSYISRIGFKSDFLRGTPKMTMARSAVFKGTACTHTFL